MDAEIAKDQDWWHKPEYICNDLNINSAISTPSHNEELSLKPGGHFCFESALCKYKMNMIHWTMRGVEAGWFTFRGYAYNGGGKQITRVELSFDSGYSWKLATLHSHERPNRYGKVSHST